ncbi:MAG: hypothetical protein GY756_21170, partial [bacterium]|nr:hypothetical protein [bacterium]
AKTLDRLSTLIDANSYNSEIKIDSSIIEIIEERILPSVSWLDEGLFLEEENRTSVEESFKAGNLLLKSGSLLKNDFYISIGRQMIISILDRASESSFVPKTIYAKDNKISNQEGSLPPELFYFDLTDNPFYSVQNNLIDTLGSGSWIYTSAKQFEIQANSKETHITVNFPKGSIHHFAIKGVKPFKKLIMWGLEWRTAPDFQRYDAGWVYDKTNETLYIKLQHRAEIEKIRILYYDPKTAENSGTSD